MSILFTRIYKINLLQFCRCGHLVLMGYPVLSFSGWEGDVCALRWNVLKIIFCYRSLQNYWRKKLSWSKKSANEYAIECENFFILKYRVTKSYTGKFLPHILTFFTRSFANFISQTISLCTRHIGIFYLKRFDYKV